MPVPLISELTLPGAFDFSGIAQIGRMTEQPSPQVPIGNLIENRLVQTDQQVDFYFEWRVKGIFAHIMDPNSKWKLELFFEKYGPGEFAFGPGVGEKTLLYSSGITAGAGLNAEMQYPGLAGSTTITIPGGTIPEGVYDVVAVLRYLESNNSPCFLAAFAEFGKINFYQEH